LLALRCPKCEAPLPARDPEVLFLCPQCPTAVEATGDGLTAHALEFHGDGARYEPWWRLDATIHIKKFSATKNARTPFGEVREGATLPVQILVPAGDRHIGDAYRAALAATALSTGPRQGGSAAGGVLHRAEAEKIARHVFLTHVARAEGQVHHLEFDLIVSGCAVVARSA
jgi:hypothetical protein